MNNIIETIPKVGLYSLSYRIVIIKDNGKIFTKRTS
jgi:hypothetical protein